MRRILALCLCLLPLAGQARDIDGVAVPEKITVTGGGSTLVLNGAGLRTRYWVKVYVVGLYLPQPETTAAAVLEGRADRVIGIHMRRDSDSEQIATAFLTSVSQNHTRAEMQAMQDRVTQFRLLMPSLKRNDVLRLEFPASGETRVVLNDDVRGTIKGADFQRALLKIWLGDKPVDEGVKHLLLGAKP